jgi:predicted  nucleic acid-binding Zn-ribbon protein
MTTPAAAADLRELHGLHERAKAIRDRLTSAPKTLAARQALLANRQAELEAAKKALLDAKAQVKKRESLVASQQSKIDDLTVKLNTVKKNEEYKAIQNQIAHDKLSISKVEDEILDGMTRLDDQAAALATQEKDVQSLAADVAKLKTDIESQAEQQKSQLESLETAITEAEEIIPIDQRDQYRRLVKQRAADALAAVEGGACGGCYVSVTAQTLNELINGGRLIFCNTCGRVQYLAEEEIQNTRRNKR